MLPVLMLIGQTLATTLNPLYAVAQSPGSCSFYSCLTRTHITDFYSICLTYYSNQTYNSLTCDNYNLPNNFCDSTSIDPTDPSTYIVYCEEPNTHYSGLYPGESPCMSKADCLSNICENSYCVGIDLGSPCNYTYQCEQGLYCAEADPSFNISGICYALTRPYNGPCITDFDCVNSAGCDFSFTDSVGTCIPYFSLQNYQNISNCADFASLLCESGTCNNFPNGTSMCVPAFYTNKTYPIQCVSGNECADNTKTVYSQCTCGMNPNASSYCEVLPGNSIAVEFLNILKKWVNSYHILSCSTEERFAVNCLKNWDVIDFDNFMYYWEGYSNHPQLVNNLQCTIDIFNYRYYEFKQNVEMDKQNSSSLFISLGAILTILLG